MKQFVHSLIITIIGLVFLMGCQSQKAIIRGPEGKIAYKITLPEGFDITKDHCPTVVIQPLFQFLLRQKSCHSI